MKNAKTADCAQLRYDELFDEALNHNCNDPDECAVCEELAGTPEPDEHVYCNNHDCPICMDYDVEQWGHSHQTSVEIHDAIADLAHGRADIEAIWYYLNADDGQRREECKKRPNENVLFWGDGFSPEKIKKIKKNT